MMYVLGVCLLVISSFPLIILVGAVVALYSGFPIFYAQKRVGRGGKPFIIYKFRTMRVGAQQEQRKLRKFNEADGPVFKIDSDPRYTKIGRLLAHTGLDELPQLYNVLRGDMALFGPRPLPVDEAAKLAPWMRERHAIKPGILSPAILTGKYHEDFDAWMKMDVAYVQEKDLFTDMKLTFKSISFFWLLLRSALKQMA